MITILTIATGDMERVWDVAKLTWVPYCARHGYVLKTLNALPAPNLHPSWNKVQAGLNELAGASGPVWCVDADITVANPAVPLESPGLAQRDLWFSHDWNGICAGMFRVVPNEWCETFLATVLLCGDVVDPDKYGKGLGCKWEQNAFKALIQEFPAVKAHVGVLPDLWVWDHPEKPRPTDVFWHFGGRPNDVRIALMKKAHNL